MAFSLTVAALLHPWSGRIDMASRLPLRRNESAISSSLPFTVDGYPTTMENYKMKHKRLSVDLSWLIRGQRDTAKCEVAEEEESTSSISDIQSNVLSSDDATCECSDNMSDTLEVETNDTCETQEETCNTDVNSQIPTATKAPPILSAILKMSPEPMYGNEYFEIAKSSVAGWGAFATRDLTKGDVILREMPLFVAETDKEGRAQPPFASFAVAHHVSGLFPIAARFNHACDPINNVEYEFDHDNGVLTLMVREDVTDGTELKISYGKNLSPQDFSGQTIPVHKIIVFSQSSVIEQTYYEEWGHGKYAICGYDFDDVERLVDYLYTGDYKTRPSDSSEEQDKSSELITHGNLMGLADEYSIPGLLQLSMEKGKAAVRDEPEICTLIECIPKVYELVINPDSKIFDMMIESIRERSGSISIDHNTRYISNFAMQEVPDFARGLAMSFVRQQPQNEDVDLDL
ncbi:hypothetical protein V8C34DRAFT_327788 [Trichoderma compactum]